jgi:hypothetical protein
VRAHADHPGRTLLAGEYLDDPVLDDPVRILRAGEAA